MNTNIFEAASRMKLRFPINGSLSVEQLWTAKESDLINYEEQLLANKENRVKTSRRTPVKKSLENQTEDLRLSIVSHILDTLQSEREALASANEAKERRSKILALIEEKKDENLKNMSVEELEKLL